MSAIATKRDKRILVTHVGRLERPDELTQLMAADAYERPTDAGFAGKLKRAVADIVRQQADAGIDIVCDGEVGKLSWVTYATTRLTGCAQEPDGVMWAAEGKDRRDFADYYSAVKGGLSNPHGSKRLVGWPAFTGPVKYAGQKDIQADIENLRAALKDVDVADAFVPSVAPGSILFNNRHYATRQELFEALALAMREEYRAIIEAGFILQVDEPAITSLWDRMLLSQDMKTFTKECEARIDALNYALEGLDPQRVRVHVCWGSWHGPHSTDMPLDLLIPMLNRMNVGGYVLEAGNVRHEHEWQVWKKARLPEGRYLVPGLVSHATDTIEHPEVVAWRAGLFADAVGRDNVIVGTDCGLGYRVHNQIAWAKLRALKEGADLASKRLWPSSTRVLA